MGLLARDIMKTDVVSVPTNMDLRDLAKLLLEKGITGAPVVDDEGRLAGVISQTDLVYYNLTRGDELVLDSHFYHSARVEGRHVPAGFQFEDFNSGCVADVMTPVVHSVTEQAKVESVARLMTRNHIHRVIVRRGQTVAGVISALDVLEASRRSPARAKSAGRRNAGAKAVKTVKTVKTTHRKAGSRSKSKAGRRRVAR
jgi:CBS domain-containing protein